MTSNPWVARAFPAALHAEAARVAELLPDADISLAGGFTVAVEGERLTIPARMYHAPATVGAQWLTVPTGIYFGDAAAEWEREGPLVATMAAAVYTRSHDGWARQRALRRTLAAPVLAPWMIPFVVELVGEYVVEIVEDIAAVLADVGDPSSTHHAVVGRYLADNPEVVRLGRARVASYWNCYYRGTYPALADYPGQQLVVAFSRAASIAVVAPASAASG